MPSNRDRARERQARRRAEGGRPVDDPRELMRQELETGGPPVGSGAPESTPDYEPDDDDSLDDPEVFDPALDDPDEEVAPTHGWLAKRGEDGDAVAAEHSNSPRFVQFLAAVRAELARVQWPDRQTLTTLTGVVLGFVLIAGGYLGLLDAVFSRLVQAIL